jgi:large subunit ribosomal protein L10
LAITKEKKEQLVESYVDLLNQSQAIVLVQSRGLSVAQVTDLRTRIREAGSKYHVVKNTLFQLALNQAGKPVPNVLAGPISAAFCIDDIAPTVEAIESFGNSFTDGRFEIVGGIVEQDLLDAERAKGLASLPSRDTLFAQILTGINAPASQAVAILANSVRQILNVLQARVDQLREGEAVAG